MATRRNRSTTAPSTSSSNRNASSSRSMLQRIDPAVDRAGAIEPRRRDSRGRCRRASPDTDVVVTLVDHERCEERPTLLPRPQRAVHEQVGDHCTGRWLPTDGGCSMQSLPRRARLDQLGRPHLVRPCGVAGGVLVQQRAALLRALPGGRAVGQRLGEHHDVAGLHRHLDRHLGGDPCRCGEVGLVAAGHAQEPAAAGDVVDECPLHGDQSGADVAAVDDVVLRRDRTGCRRRATRDRPCRGA